MSAVPGERTPGGARTPARWPALLAIGAVGGLLSGLFGVGGGILMVPLLLWLGGLDQRRAATTSLAAIVPTSLVGALSYLARGEVDLLVAALVAAGGVAGSWAGSWLLRRTPLRVLRWGFVGLLVLVAARLLVEADPAAAGAPHVTPASAAALVAVGLVTGVTAGLFGIGGGVVVVPALMLLVGVGPLLAKGTSLVVMLPTAASGTIANVRAKAVDLRAGLVVGAAASAASFAGVALAFRLPDRVATVLFGALVLVTAVQLATRALRADRVARSAPPEDDGTEVVK